MTVVRSGNSGTFETVSSAQGPAGAVQYSDGDGGFVGLAPATGMLGSNALGGLTWRQTFAAYASAPSTGGDANESFDLLNGNPLTTILTSGAFTYDAGEFTCVLAGRYRFEFRGTVQNASSIPVSGMSFAWVPSSELGGSIYPDYAFRVRFISNSAGGAPCPIDVINEIDCNVGDVLSVVGESVAGGGIAFNGPNVQIAITPIG